MKKTPVLLTLSITAAMLLTGCSSGSETPYLDSPQSSSASQSNAVKTPSASSSDPKETTDGSTPSETTNPVLPTVDPANPLNKGPEAEPYTPQDKYIGDAGVLQEGEKPVPAANEGLVKPEDAKASTVTLDTETTASLSTIHAAYKTALRESNWEKACSYVYISEGKTLEDCVNALTASGNLVQPDFDFKDAGAGINQATKVLTIQKFVNEDMGTQRATFIKDETGAWRVFVAAVA